VLVKILFGMTRDPEAEEAVVAGFAAIGTLKKQAVTDPIIGALSQRPVSLGTTCEEGSFKVLATVLSCSGSGNLLISLNV